MADQISATAQDPKYAGEILVHLKKFESITNSLHDSSEYTSTHYEEAIDELNDSLIRLLTATHKPPVSSPKNSKQVHSISKTDILSQLKSTYRSNSLEDLEKLANSDGELEMIDSDRIPLVTESQNLDNWVSVVEFVTNHLDNIILSKLREIYATVECVEIDMKELLLEDISSLISTIINTVEKNRTQMLHLKKIDNQIPQPVGVSGITYLFESLNKKQYQQHTDD